MQPTWAVGLRSTSTYFLKRVLLKNQTGLTFYLQTSGYLWLGAYSISLLKLSRQKRLSTDAQADVHVQGILQSPGISRP